MTTETQPKRRIRWKLWLIPGVLLLLPAYGFIYGLSHAHVSISLHDVSAVRDQNRLHNAELTFLDAQGDTLATARTEPHHGAVEFNYPDLGDCAQGTDRGERWQACSRERAQWFASWANKLDQINLSTPGCLLRHLPVKPRVIRDIAWTWWIPHPEIGGTPNTYYSLYIVLDSRQCRLISQK